MLSDIGSLAFMTGVEGTMLFDTAPVWLAGAVVLSMPLYHTPPSTTKIITTTVMIHFVEVDILYMKILMTVLLIRRRLS
jgi:hypothetical protein